VGRLELTTNPGVSVNSFTQDDLDSGRLRYVNTFFFPINDRFRFTVSDGDAVLGEAQFDIDVQ
jgi:hypothetical protein